MKPVSVVFSNLLTSATWTLMQISLPGVPYSLRTDRLFGDIFDRIGPAEPRLLAAQTTLF